MITEQIATRKLELQSLLQRLDERIVLGRREIEMAELHRQQMLGALSELDRCVKLIEQDGQPVSAPAESPTRP